MTHNGHPYRVDSYNCHDFKAEAPQRIKKERLVVAPCFNFIASIFCHHSPCFNFIAIIKYSKSQNPMQIVQRQTLESQQITRPQTLHVYTLQQTTHALPQQTAPHTYELVRTTTHNAIFQQNAPRKPNSCFGSSTNANTTNPKTNTKCFPLSLLLQARNTSRANCSGLSDSSDEEDAPAPEPAPKVLPQCTRVRI